ncbi:MAG: hypothetical protein P8X82_09610, partial [Gemmatimonadales bacterium]
MGTLLAVGVLVVIGVSTACSNGSADQQFKEPDEAALMRGFEGKIELDTRDSKPDWTPFIPKAAPKGSPNILFILYDDTGQAAWSPYGGRIHMPTLDKLAAEGLIY